MHQPPVPVSRLLKKHGLRKTIQSVTKRVRCDAYYLVYLSDDGAKSNIQCGNQKFSLTKRFFVRRVTVINVFHF